MIVSAVSSSVRKEGGILLGQRHQRLGHLVLVGLGLGLHRDVNHRVGELERLQLDEGGRIAQRVAGAGVLHADCRDDVAGADPLLFDLILGVHLQQAAHALLVAAPGVQHLIALGDLARIHPEVGQLADVVGGHDLEGEGAEGLVVLGGPGDRLALAIGSVHRRKVERAGHVEADCVQQRLHTLVFEGGAVEHGHEPVVQGGLAQGGPQLGGAQLLLVDELLHDRLVGLGEHVDEFLAVLVGQVDQVGGNVGDLPRRAQLLAVPDPRLHRDQVDDARVLGLGADRQLDDSHLGVEALLDRGQRAEEVGTGAVHLVDEAHARHVVLVGLTPHGFGLRLNAGHPVEDGDGAVEHPQRTLHLDGEVHVARRIDDLDAVVHLVDRVGPVRRRGRRRDRDAPLLLLDHPVHRGGAVVHLTNLVALAGVEEDPLGRGGLTGIDVGHDADVAGSFEGKV